MLKQILFIIFLMCLSTVVSIAQQNFEGIVEVKLTNSRGETNDLKFYTKGDAFKLQSEDGVKNGNLLIKNDSIYVLMPEQQKYLQMPINVNNKVTKYSSRADSLQPTGEIKEILGYQAEKWLFEENGTSVEIWSTKELGNVVNMEYFIPEVANEGWYKDVFGNGFFPLSVTVSNASHNVVNKIEVTDIEKKDLSDDEFDLPEGFERLQTKKQ